MVLIYYLGKTIELTIEEYEQIMRCPNYIYISKSGYMVKGADSKLSIGTFCTIPTESCDSVVLPFPGGNCRDYYEINKNETEDPLRVHYHRVQCVARPEHILSQDCFSSDDKHNVYVCPPTPPAPTPPTPTPPLEVLENRKKFLEKICVTKYNTKIPHMSLNQVPSEFTSEQILPLLCDKLNLCGIRIGSLSGDLDYYSMNDTITKQINLIKEYYINDASINNFNKNHKIIDPSTNTNIWCGENSLLGNDEYCNNFYNEMKKIYSDQFSNNKVLQTDYNQWINNTPNCDSTAKNNCATITEGVQNDFPNNMCLTVGVNGTI